MKAKRNLKFYILACLSILFTLFIFIEETMPSSWSKAQNDWVSNITNKVLQFFRGNIYYTIDHIELIDEFKPLGDLAGENTIGVNEICVLKYKYREQNKEYEKDIHYEILNKDYTQIQYEFRDDFLYFYIQSEIKGDNTLSIYNKKNQLLDEYSYKAIDDIKEINYDIILNMDEVQRNSYITFDYSFYNHYYDTYMNYGFFKMNNHYDTYTRKDVLSIGSSNLLFMEYYIKLLYLDNFKFKTSSPYIEVLPYQQYIVIDSKCEPGPHYIENEKGNRYYFTVLDSIYNEALDNPNITISKSSTSSYLSTNHKYLEEDIIKFENMTPEGFRVVCTNPKNYYFFPEYYYGSDGNIKRATKSFFIYMKEVTSLDTFYIETIASHDGIKIQSNVVELKGYEMGNVPEVDNEIKKLFKTYPFEIFKDGTLLEDTISLEMKKGEIQVFDVRINHEAVGIERPLYAFSSRTNIIKATIDQEESKLYIECLDYGEATVSFNDSYKNNYGIKCYTKDGYVIKDVGGLSLNEFVQKNLGHIACYILLGFLISLTIYAYFGFKDLNMKYYFIGMLITMTYGMIAEFLQYFIPGRIMSTLDFLRNTISVFLGFAIVYIIYLFRYYLKPKEAKLF